MRHAMCLVLAIPFVTINAVAQNMECKDVPREYPPYNRSDNSAHYAVTYFGSVLHRPQQPVDEDDRVIVHVVTTHAMAPMLRVRRKSAIRPVGTINIVGGDTPVTDAQRRIQQAFTTGDPCDLEVALADFAPGRGEVEIGLVYHEGTSIKEVTLGTFDFSVQPLYSGAFSLGAIRSELEDYRYALAPTPAGNIVSETELGDSRVLYALFFTPFIWGKRDLEKPARHFYHRINPSVGITLTDPADNAVAGLTIDLPIGVFLHGGIHAGKITELNSSSGAGVGLPYDGETVPTQRRWRTKPYAGVTVDLRAMVRLLRTAASTSLN